MSNPKIDRAGKPADRFNVTVHMHCWKRFKVRPAGGSAAPQETNWRYCIYDERHNDYGYTQAWVDFLIVKLKDAAEFDAVCKGEQASDAAGQST